MRPPIPTQTREAVVIRDMHCCARCYEGWRLEIHHRKGRGGKDPHRLSNLITLCAPCHQWVTEHPADAYERGLSIRRGTTDMPDEVPYLDGYGKRFALTDDGQRIPLI